MSSRRSYSLPVTLLASVLFACGPSSSTPGASASSSGAEAAEQAEGVALGSLAGAIAGSHRSAANRARDAARHPRETLEFFGVRTGQRVVELWPALGWYTEILAPLLHEDGSLVAVVPEGKELEPYLGLLQSHPDLYAKVELVTVTPPLQLSLGPEESADVILSFRDFHEWLKDGYVDALHAEIFRTLKPGGVYGVVEHRAKPGTSAELSAQTGYVAEELVIEAATKAGLVLEARSQVNANPRDTKDYPAGVWTLPPTLRLGAQDRARYEAIGESDRMTLRFRKPSIL
jgi:predicted methyltransferase